MKKLTLLCTLFWTVCAHAQTVESNFSKLFGDALLDYKGDPVALSKLEGKHVGIYFTAGWCGPCRRFSPLLVQFREKFSEDLEVVMVGGDQSQQTHDAYMKKAGMKWLQLQWGSDQAKMLKQGFRVNGIPMLILVNPKGEVLSQKGRELIVAHRELLQAESNRLVFDEELYKCGSCEKQHRKITLRTKDA